MSAHSCSQVLSSSPEPPRASPELIASAALGAYESLPRGKPRESEWTVLAAVILEDGASLRVLSLGTGSKCVGRDTLRAGEATGGLVRDTHAEVIARRSLLRVLYSELGAWLRGRGDVSAGDRG